MFTFLTKNPNENEVGTEEEKVVMNKTIFASSDKSEPTVKVDHLDSNNEMEKDAAKVMKSERDVTATLPLPLFRFEEKQKPELITILKEVSRIATEMMKENEGAKWTSLIGYIKVQEEKDIKYLLDLNISRNKELYNSSPKEVEVEIVTCFYDKKLRVEFNISEDELANESDHEKFFAKKRAIRAKFNEFFEELVETVGLKETGFEKDVKILIKNSEGSEDFGAGLAIVVKYEKPIDYANQKRGKEDYDPIALQFIDKDFAQSIEEQNSINLVLGEEAIAEGMAEGSDSENNEDNNDENEQNEEESSGDNDFGGGDDDDAGGDEMEDDEFSDDGEGEGEDGEESDSSSDSGSSSTQPKQPAGQNPFADINSREAICEELKELKEQIDKALIKLAQFKSNGVVTKLEKLSKEVEDALKSAYVAPIADTSIRYNLYLVQFGDLINSLQQSLARAAKHKD